MSNKIVNLDNELFFGVINHMMDSEDILDYTNDEAWPGFEGIYVINIGKKTRIVESLPSTDESQSLYSCIVSENNHWSAIFIDFDRQHVEYFDPCGSGPSLTCAKIIHGFCKPIRKEFSISVNTNKLQPNNTATCGPHCLRFLRDRYQGKSFEACVDITSKQAETEVHELVENYRNKKLKQLKQMNKKTK